MKINRVDDLQIFVAAADTNSFSEAARRLGMSPVVASAVIKRLETSLGVRLFERSTRHIRITDQGERFLPHAREALRALSNGEMSIEKDKSVDALLTGTLRLSLPSDLGRNSLVGWIEQFIASQPDKASVSLELRVSDRLSDLLQQPVDFAIRYGILEDSGFIALPIALDNRRVLCASPAYLASKGMPEKLTDLRLHNCLRFVMNDAVHSRWQFEEQANATIFEAKGNRIADDAAVVRQWALDGLGIAYKSWLDVAPDIAAGRLKILLPKLRGEPAPLYFLAVSKQQITNGIRRLVASLSEQCKLLKQANEWV